MKNTLIAGGLAAAVAFTTTLLGASPASADSGTDLQYEVCTAFDKGVDRVTIAKAVIVSTGYSVRQTADIMHDAVMDHCIEHAKDLWPN